MWQALEVTDQCCGKRGIQKWAGEMRQEAWEERVGLWGSTSCFVSILRAVGSQCPFFVLARSPGFGMEYGWDVHIDQGRYSGKRRQPALGSGFREKWKDERHGDEVTVFDD